MIRAIFFDAGGVLYVKQNSKGVLNRELIQFIRNNQSRYRMGIVSNTTSNLKRILVQDNVDSLFEIVITSGEFGIEKPDVRIFQHALRSMNVKPEETILVDNDQECVRAALQLGMHGILYRSFGAFIRQMDVLVG